MKYTAVVEIPKGNDRRIHKSIETKEFVDFGPTKDIIPVNNGIMPADYGFIENTLNKDEGDEVDVIIISNREHRTGDKINIDILGMIVREDGDHKIIAKDETSAISNIQEIPDEEWKLILEFFGHKYKITSVEDKAHALTYLQNSKI